MEWKWNEIRREILLEWSDSPENSPFNKEDLETVGRLTHEPIKNVKILGKYILNIYELIPLKNDYTPKHVPIMGVDVSGGYNQDASCITIIDSRTTRVFADLKCNYISPIDLARVIYEIVTIGSDRIVIALLLKKFRRDGYEDAGIFNMERRTDRKHIDHLTSLHRID